MISAQQNHPKQTIKVLGHNMAYVDVGEGEPILFLHGNPTSSYLWRNIINPLQELARCIAPDLIGMGDSAKLPNSNEQSYQFVEHRKYLDEFIAQLGLKQKVHLVLHDWGSALGFDWAYRHQQQVKSITYMEAIVKPLQWSEFSELARPAFEAMRSEQGEEMVLQQNFFVEQLLPLSVMRKLSEEEMNVYRKPFINAGEDRRPTLTWPRQIPLQGSPADVHNIVDQYSQWLKHTDIPKLFINAEPGVMVTGEVREYCRGFAAQQEITVAGLHYVQEDSPQEIATAVAEFLNQQTV